MPSPREVSWLILSHGFNMDGRASSLTITDKIPHLLDRGIVPVVVSAVTGSQDQHLAHYRILPWGPAGLRFDLRHQIALLLGRGITYKILTGLISLVLLPGIIVERALMGLQSQWSWMPAAVFRGLLAIRRHRVALIYSTGGAYSAHWTGYILKKITGLPWMAEIHDPMIFPGTVPKTRNLKFQAQLEGMICREADVVLWFTEGARTAARIRHPELNSRGYVIYPGAEPPRLSDRPRYQKREKLILAHFGSLSSVRSMKPFVERFKAFKDRFPDAAEDIEVHCYGGQIDANAKDALHALNLQGHFKLHGRLETDPNTGLSGRERIQIKMREADALLLIHGNTLDCAEYIPSKWYDYLWAERPVLAFTHINLILAGKVEEHGGYAVEIDDEEACLSTFQRLHADWQQGLLRRSALPPIGTGQAVEAIFAALEEQLGSNYPWRPRDIPSSDA